MHRKSIHDFAARADVSWRNIIADASRADASARKVSHMRTGVMRAQARACTVAYVWVQAHTHAASRADPQSTSGGTGKGVCIDKHALTKERTHNTQNARCTFTYA